VAYAATLAIPAAGCFGASRDGASAANNGVDGGVVCTGPLADAGFSSLANLPIAELCADSTRSGSGLVLEGTASCGGTTMISEGTGTDSYVWWLFESTTGALKASGEGSDTSLSSSSAAPGFSYPNECFNGFLTNPWAPNRELCPDGI
jgi:hypothetical protein